MDDLEKIGQKFPNLEKFSLYVNLWKDEGYHGPIDYNKNWNIEHIDKIFERYFRNSTEIDFDLLQPKKNGDYEHYKIERKPYNSLKKKFSRKVKFLSHIWDLYNAWHLPALETIEEDSNDDIPNKK